MSGIHTLDMSKLASASVVDLDAFASELLECFSTQGMVKLKNAPIPDEFIEGAFEMVYTPSKIFSNNSVS